MIDPQGNQFGTLDPKTSAGLAPLLDGAAISRLRVSATIEPRRKRKDEHGGAAIPGGTQLFLLVVLYAPRRHADKIGTFLAKKQLWLKLPPKWDSKTEYYNPHAPKVARTQVSTGNGKTYMPNEIGYGGGGYGSSSYGGYVARTQEEISMDVMNMFDSLTKSEDLPEKNQDSRITTPLLSHQKQALFFMTEHEQEPNLDAEDQKHALWKPRIRANGARAYYNVITGQETATKPAPVLGGILADMMGLGKTLSILALIVDSLEKAQQWSSDSQNPNGKAKTKATLLVAPVSTIANWREQLDTHLEQNAISWLVHHGPSRTQDIRTLQKYDLVITTYDTVSQDFGNHRGTRPLHNIHWFRVVLDEAHAIRSQQTRRSQSICALDAQRRWAVTGTPIQNRLDDLGALIKFLRIKPLDEKGGFTQHILTPFKMADHSVLARLRLLVDSITLRRLKDKIDLPPRRENIVWLHFSDDEYTLYNWFAKYSQQRFAVMTFNRSKLGGKDWAHVLRALLRLRLISAHGQELLSDEDMKLTEGISYGNAIDLGDDDDDDKPVLSPKQAYDMLDLLRQTDMDKCPMCERRIGQVDAEAELDGKFENSLGFMTPCYHAVCPRCMPVFKEMIKDKTTSDNYMTCPLCEQYVKVSFFELCQDGFEAEQEAQARIRANPKLSKQLARYSGPHTKTKALLQSLEENRQWSLAHVDEPPIKSVVFSGWTSHLDLIEVAFNNVSPPIVFTRLDGTMSLKNRGMVLDKFKNDPSVEVILVSISAGGLGLNLTSASRVYVMEPQFNPAAEAQAIDRVHRLGQRREVIISKFIMRDSIEVKVLDLQKKKTQLAEMSLEKGKVTGGREEEQKRKLEELRSLFR
jgi:SNF2 family DNA or RNA helicase